MTTQKKIQAVQYFILGMLLVLCFALAFIPNTYASTFPSDTITFTFTNGVNSRADATPIYTNVAGETLTLLGSSMNNGGGTTIGNETHIFCGTLVAIDNMAVSSTGQMQHAIKCSQNIYADIGKYTHMRLSYVKRDIATTLDPLAVVTVTSLATSTMATVTNGFTYGESLQILLLIMLFTLLLFSTVKNWLFGTKVQNTKRDVIIKKDI